MGRTKQTPQGSASHRPVGMTAATFTSMGRGKAGPEEQFRDTLGEDTEEERKVNQVQVSPRVSS